MDDVTPPKKNRIVGPGRIRLRFDVTGTTQKACNEEATRAANAYFQGRPHQLINTKWTTLHYTDPYRPTQLNADLDPPTIGNHLAHYTYLGDPE